MGEKVLKSISILFFYELFFECLFKNLGNEFYCSNGNFIFFIM